ncbi:hypothetical protein COB21_03925 [Candidatus Aerophobetes bacterium]|uniref:Uncharacterized protein n=1 Tax=Aerophobetes bacterium TaxID=2030807 RepID=A0A2A4X3B5_UNCAE|nr:MAG: hypothetical protein COB21_03925 [Candidatus Aerophobetes bacterium]
MLVATSLFSQDTATHQCESWNVPIHEKDCPCDDCFIEILERERQLRGVGVVSVFLGGYSVVPEEEMDQICITVVKKLKEIGVVQFVQDGFTQDGKKLDRENLFGIVVLGMDDEQEESFLVRGKLVGKATLNRTGSIGYLEMWGYDTLLTAGLDRDALIEAVEEVIDDFIWEYQYHNKDSEVVPLFYIEK